MKRILFILSFLISFAASGQYQLQWTSNANTLYYGKGLFGADSGYVHRKAYADTTAANRGYVDLIPGAMIRTTGDLIWLRNDAATKWVYVGGAAGGGGGGGTNIYNSDGTLLGDRNVDLATADLNFFRVSDKSLFLSEEFNLLKDPTETIGFEYYPDSLRVLGIGQSASSSDSVLVRTASGKVLSRAQSAIAAPTPTWQQTLTAGSTLTGNNAASMGTFKFDYNWTDGDYFSIQNHRLEYYSESGSGVTFKSIAYDFTPDDGFIQAFDAVYASSNYLMGVGSGGTYDGDGTGVLMQVSGPDSMSRMLVKQGEIRIKPDRGSLLIDSLRVGASTDSVMVWNRTTGYVGYRNVASLITASNGLTLTGSTLTWEGTLTKNTVINQATYDVTFNNNLGTGLFIIESSEQRISLVSGVVLKRNATSIDATLATENFYSAVDAASGNKVITLPDASGNTGQVYVIKKLDNSSNTVTVQGTGGDPIDGDANYVLADSSAFVWVISNDTDWEIIGKSSAGSGSTPTLQQVLTAGSTLTTSNTINSDGNALTIQSDNGTNRSEIYFDASDLDFNAYASGKVTAVQMNADSLLFQPHLGVMNIDTLRTASDTTLSKPMTYDPATGRWQYLTYWPGGAGGAGTVTDFIFTDGGGFDGTVATSTSTPTLSLTTTVADTRVMFSTSGAISGDAGMTYSTANDRLTLVGNIDGSANGVLFIDGTGTGNLGTGLSMDATNESGGRIKTIFSTGTTSSAGAGALAVYDVTSGYHMVITGAGETRIGSGADTDAGDFTLQVRGSGWFNAGVTINDGASDSDTRIEGDTDANLVFVDASADKVGIGTNAPTSLLMVDGSFSVPITSTTEQLTLGDDHTKLVDATGSAVTIDLPAAAGCVGRIYVIKKIDSSINAVTVDASGGELIDGATTYSLATQYKYVMVQSNGSAWYVIGNN
jgi:hypothetical protein